MKSLGPANDSGVPKDELHIARRAAYMHEYNAGISEQKKAYNKQWYQDHKEQAKAKSRKYRLDNPESSKAATVRWRADNKEYLDAYHKSYFAKNQPRLSQNAREKKQALFAQDPKRAWLHYTTQAARSRAKERNLPFDKDLSKLLLPDVCPVLGIKLIYGRRGRNRRGPLPDSPSLDRIVPERGYVLSNLRVISWRANLLKRDSSVDEIKRVLAYMEECLLMEKTA